MKDLTDFNTIKNYIIDSLPKEYSADVFMFLLKNPLLVQKTIEAIEFMRENDFDSVSSCAPSLRGPGTIIHDVIGLSHNDDCFAPKVIKIECEEINYPINHFA